MATAKKLPSGSWRCRVLVRTDTIQKPDGSYEKKKIYKSFTCSDPSRKGKKEAERMAAEYLLSNAENRDCDLTLQEAMENVIEIKKNTLSPTTIRTYKSLIRTAYPSIIKQRLDRIQSKDIQRAMNDLALEKSPKHVRNAYGFFTSVVSIYLPDKTFHVKLPQAERPQTHTPTEKEVLAVITYLREKDPELLKAVYLAAFGSLRRSEICAAEASDLKGDILKIDKAMVQNDNLEWVIKGTKTEGSTRYVSLPAFVVSSMPKEGRLVDLNPTKVTKRFIRAVKKCDVETFRFHDLRHYCASIMHALGIPDQYIMAQGGWHSDGVLKRVYRDAMDDYRKRFSDQANAHFQSFFEKDDTKDDTNVKKP